MRILHILDHSLPLQSGYTFRTYNIIREQRILGLETFHLTGPKQTLDTIPPPEETSNGMRFYRTSPSRNLFSRLPVTGELSIIHGMRKRLYEIVEQVQPDILHAHSPALNGIAMLKAGKRLKIPMVYEVRGFWEDAAVSHGTTRRNSLKYRMSRAVETRVLHNVDAVSCICQGIKKDLIYRGITEDKISTIPNAVDPDSFVANPKKDPELERALNLAGKRVVGFVGSFYTYEGLKLLLAAMPAIIRQNPDVRLLLVGGGQDAEDLRKLAKASGIEKQVILTGRIAHDQVRRYYSLIDILCYPRLPMRLTQLVTPLKPLEAMAQEKPVLASDVGGHRELIRDGETGILFRAGDVDDLISKIHFMFNNEHAWPEIVAAGRRFIESERTWKSSVANYIPVYERLQAG
ncbi:MAG: glycosyltransferase, exosortase A system-associated [Gammaproteobacteria bacterium]|nr:glycosyltransferase, exosortase A system-associated [Gammaproteobacteria bacterium]